MNISFLAREIMLDPLTSVEDTILLLVLRLSRLLMSSEVQVSGLVPCVRGSLLPTFHKQCSLLHQG